ncbi:carbohydrate ABC transporter permease [Pseudoruegeria sp. SHC-113]|uniref:carbohydrate ABC transporter permease n=1 Tax=Pseudoruegeria sp. SHC-113 TaxID=2855439 RepID=UPI0021BA427F|nr:sugar ABC transporter permease [Pseudoruegeria sp. SHC-113]MCT8159526.1 sugar ABC transporter permease [Pseudoruegeria sp. SHC-113]
MRSDTFWRYATLAPAVILFLVLTILPLFNLGALGFHKVEWVDRQAVWEWEGLRNYAHLAKDTLFKAGILNTIIFSVVAVAFQMVLGFWLALLTTRVTRFRIFYRTVFILPILVPGIIIGAIWKLMYSYDFGVINQVILWLGGNPVDWLGNPDLALMSVIIVDVWHWTPFCFLLMLASLESLPQDIFEAAEIDGAGRWQVLRHIVLPLMLPAIIVTFIFRMILAFKVFDEIYLLTGGGPGTSTEVISYTIYRRFFTEDQIGYGSAMSLATIAVIATLIILASRFATKKGPNA